MSRCCIILICITQSLFSVSCQTKKHVSEDSVQQAIENKHWDSVISGYVPKPTFRWTDTSFEVGRKRRIGVNYSLDKPIPIGADSICDTIVRFMKHNIRLKIGIYCYTDQQGEDRHNLILSNARAMYFVDLLFRRGGDSARINYRGFGDSQPIIPMEIISKMEDRKEKDKAYYLNRRTAIVIIDTDYKKNVK